MTDREVWVDHRGVVHERHGEDPTRTLCGLNAGETNDGLIPRACRDCVVVAADAEEALVQMVRSNSRPWPMMADHTEPDEVEANTVRLAQRLSIQSRPEPISWSPI